MIIRQSCDTATEYFDRFRPARVNVELLKGNLTKHEEWEKTERDDGNNTNPENLWKTSFYPWLSLNVMTL